MPVSTVVGYSIHLPLAGTDDARLAEIETVARPPGIDPAADRASCG